MNTMTDPFQAPAVRAPRTAMLEILEQHSGDRLGSDIPLAPNLLRVNGIDLHATEDDPITVLEFQVDGRPGTPLVVTLRFLARALGVGPGAYVHDPDGKTCLGRSFVSVEIPHLTGDPGPVEAPFAMIDGMPILLGGAVVVHSVDLDGGRKGVLVVDVPLLCRSVVFDDERV